MSDSIIENQLHEAIHALPLEQQEKVLVYVRSLSAKQLQGVTGTSLLRFAGTIDAQDLAVIKETIGNGCEQVNEDEW